MDNKYKRIRKTLNKITASLGRPVNPIVLSITKYKKVKKSR